MHLQRFTIEKVPPHRVLWAFVLGTIQVFISVWLLLVGAQWLATTTRASDLVLNAVALTYIMEIDELLFVTVVPRQIHDLITKLAPITVEMRNLWCRKLLPAQLPTGSLTAVFAMVAFILFVAVGELQSHARHVDSVIGVICG